VCFSFTFYKVLKSFLYLPILSTCANAVSDCYACRTDGLRQLFTFQSLQMSDNASGDDSGHSLVENVMLSDTLLWKGNHNCCMNAEINSMYHQGQYCCENFVI